MSDVEIVLIPELIGRTIVEATRWSDNESLSLRLDNGGILQIDATIYGTGNDTVMGVRYQIEFAPSKEDK